MYGKSKKKKSKGGYKVSKEQPKRAKKKKKKKKKDLRKELNQKLGGNVRLSKRIAKAAPPFGRITGADFKKWQKNEKKKIKL